jgi:hypothetical protein
MKDRILSPGPKFVLNIRNREDSEAKSSETAKNRREEIVPLGIVFAAEGVSPECRELRAWRQGVHQTSCTIRIPA